MPLFRLPTSPQKFGTSALSRRELSSTYARFSSSLTEPVAVPKENIKEGSASKEPTSEQVKVQIGKGSFKAILKPHTPLPELFSTRHLETRQERVRIEYGPRSIYGVFSVLRSVSAPLVTDVHQVTITDPFDEKNADQLFPSHLWNGQMDEHGSKPRTEEQPISIIGQMKYTMYGNSVSPEIFYAPLKQSEEDKKENQQENQPHREIPMVGC